jgi:hypothetical protein
MRPALFHRHRKARLSASDEVRGVADELMLSDAVTERRQIDPREHCLAHVAPVSGTDRKLPGYEQNLPCTKIPPTGCREMVCA